MAHELLQEADDEQLEVGGAQEEAEDVDEAAARRVRQPLFDGDERRHFLHQLEREDDRPRVEGQC